VVERIQWRVLGSELEAALEELRLIRELRPPANARGKRAGVFAYRRGDRWVVTDSPPAGVRAIGPVGSRKRARLAARALDGHASPEEALPVLRRRLRDYADCLRYEEAARMRDRLTALEEVLEHVVELERLRGLDAWLLVPAVEPGFRRAVLVTGGRIASVRTLPPGPGARLELEAGLAKARRAEPPTPDDVDELLLVGAFLRKPPPELEVVPLAARVAA
jgi:hypothetical protein